MSDTPLLRKQALSWRRAAAIAMRDLKSAPGKFAFVVLSVAIGVAALKKATPPVPELALTEARLTMETLKNGSG